MEFMNFWELLISEEIESREEYNEAWNWSLTLEQTIVFFKLPWKDRGFYFDRNFRFLFKAS